MEPSSEAKRTGLPIVAVLVFGFGGLILIAVGITLWLGFSSATLNTRALLQLRAEGFLDTLIGDIRNQLDPVEAQAEWIAAKVAAGTLDPRDEAQWNTFATGGLSGTPQVTGVAVIDPDRRLRIVRRKESKAAVDARSETQIVIEERMDAFDVDRLIAEFADDSVPTLPQWSDPKRGVRGNRVILMLHTPLRRGGEFLGVLIQGVTIADLSRPLKAASTEMGVTPFILLSGTRVLAHPLLAEPVPGNRQRELPELTDLADPYLASIWSPEEFRLELMGPMMQSQAKGVWVGDERRVFVYREISGYGPHPWIVGAHFSPEIASREVRELLWLAGTGLVILVVSVLAGLLIARVTGRPILRLARAAEQIEGENLDHFKPLPPTMLRELNDATRSFNRMVEGLRERRRIRDLFGKYVPEAVATALLRERGELTPQAVEATVLFVDLEGFTAMCERLRPAEIVEVLNAYFSVVVEILEGHGGVVTQFQGDAILAIFNVPVADPDHAGQAVQAAAAIHEAVGTSRFDGQRLACRIGINTGAVVAGSVGARGRLNYTVHGDAVNIAARLEQLNKDYGTRTLISETTAEATGDRDLRRIGALAVRGKDAPVTVYTIAGGDEKD